MTIKDIVVNLSVAEGGSYAGDYAVSVAGALNAHVTGIAFAYDPVVPVASTGYIPPEVIETQQRDSEEAAKAAIARFSAAADRAGVAAEPTMLAASFAGAGEQFGRIARRFDLAIVGQAEPDKGAVEELIAESTLFESGRPVIVVPYIQRAPLKLDRVMACWDGSRQAARAIADAMPLLERAGLVEVGDCRQRTRQAGRNSRRRHGAASRPPRPEGRHQAHQRRRASTLPTRCCRMPPISARISSSWAAMAIRGCANSCSVASRTASCGR